MTRILSFLLLLGFSNLSAFSQSSNPVYVCPPCNNECDDLKFDKTGVCNHCGMTLVLEQSLNNYKVKAKMRIAFYLQNGVEVLDFAGPMEVFAYSGYEIFTVSKTKGAYCFSGNS